MAKTLLQFYGRGLFARPPITWAGGPYSDGLQSNLRKAGFGAVTLVLSVLDNPLRLVSGGRQEAQWHGRQGAPARFTCVARHASHGRAEPVLMFNVACRSPDECVTANQVFHAEL